MLTKKIYELLDNQNIYGTIREYIFNDSLKSICDLIDDGELNYISLDTLIDNIVINNINKYYKKSK